MPVNKKQRKNLTLRLQPYEGSLLGEVVDYLNSLDRDEVNRKVAEILTISLLPLARYERGLSDKVLRFSTLESCHALSQHANFLRQVVGVNVELPSLGSLTISPLPNKSSVVKPVEEKASEKSPHPNSEFGSIDALDNLF